MTHKPKEYRHIMAWGALLASDGQYSREKQEKAAAAGAPIDAIFEEYADDGSGPNGKWAVFSEVTNPNSRRFVEQWLESHKEDTK